ncbi:hypothetical protein GLOTRDRAFT_111327 [Gloeophyllum trabeum ATCC 11539]|uniref:Uncharacterized protein n=1 Tax=Gloeophyllum trabeum (strain ATCC 11539 / FP-39264 / Madison 617) TaxID=670483 RepID=S7RP56_GLOTA|nr:uncharacterized protein GLOTRDRAFT_111327 [Gloeophyllum trabeum ATCC 11539]EPQ54584.1 hypothetical protein GLOTRDRAFT_111327 [Gloeophyllum trabeum ATCC 11539]
MHRYARANLRLQGFFKVPRRASSGSALKEHASRHNGDVPKEPQPLLKAPWWHRAAFWLRVTLVPGFLVYSVFYADWGEGDHVFRPPRKWLEQQKAAFFNLSPEERKLVETDMAESPAAPAADAPTKS